MHPEQAGHHGRILLWRPGHHLGFDVIGENGVEHRLLLVGLAGLAAPLKDDSARIIPTSGAAMKRSGNTIYRIALERGVTGARLMNRTRANAPPSRRRSCDASQPRSSAMPPDRAHCSRRCGKRAIGTTSPAITATTAVRPSMAASASSKTAARASSISAVSDR